MTLSKARMEQIGINIKNARQEQMLTQEEVAERVSLSPTYFGQLELGNKAPSLETLINIAECLRVSVDSLVYGKNEKTTAENIIRLISALDYKDVEKLEKLLYVIVREFAIGEQGTADGIKER